MRTLAGLVLASLALGACGSNSNDEEKRRVVPDRSDLTQLAFDVEDQIEANVQSLGTSIGQTEPDWDVSNFDCIRTRPYKGECLGSYIFVREEAMFQPIPIEVDVSYDRSDPTKYFIRWAPENPYTAVGG